MNIVTLDLVSHAFTAFLIGRISQEYYYKIIASTFESLGKSISDNPEVTFYKKFRKNWMASAKDHPEIPKSSVYRESKRMHPGARHTTRLIIIFTRYAFGSHTDKLTHYLDKYEIVDIILLKKLIRYISGMSQYEIKCTMIKLAYVHRNRPDNFRGYLLEPIRGGEV